MYKLSIVMYYSVYYPKKQMNCRLPIHSCHELPYESPLLSILIYLRCATRFVPQYKQELEEAFV